MIIMPPPPSTNPITLTLICFPVGSFKRRKRKSIVVTALLLVVSVLILVFGLAATTRTQNITVGGYYPGVIVSAGSAEGRSPSETIRNYSSSPNNRRRSLMGEFSPHSLFSIAVIRGQASLGVSPHKCVFFTHTRLSVFPDPTTALRVFLEHQIHLI